MNGRRFGSLSLRLDAAYCAGAALSIAACSRFIADHLSVGPFPVLLVAALVAVWATLLWTGTAHVALRPMLLAVMSANVVAALGIGVLAFAVPSLAMSLLVAAVAVEVAAFALSQALAFQAL
ncbi:hypothetical protein [Rhodococcoides fascians]|jgi:hypothetical protein|uniref:hypothetical protein n=1 Tax=Rhodococcoides fascians TaxID=1828 RepID=UPI0011409088|nr:MULTISPECIES: hypothetical protein [Rhodococcus]